jgi:hypothetical protein
MTESVSGYRPDAWAAIQWLKPLLEPETAAVGPAVDGGVQWLKPPATPGPEWLVREAEAHLAIIRLYEDADRHPNRYAGPEIIDALADVIEAIAYIYHPRLKLPDTANTPRPT